MSQTTDTTADPYKTLVDKLAIYADAVGKLASMEAKTQQEFLRLVGLNRDEFATLQKRIGELEAEIELLAIKNPQWFEKKKTLTTPYGAVQSRTSKSLEVENEEVTIALLELRPAAEQAKYIRVKKELDLEAIEKLEDAELKRLRISRVTAESFTVKAAKVNLGKAVEASKKAEDKAAAFTLLELLVVVTIGFGFVFIALHPYFEAKAYNRLTGANATYWDALWTNLRVEAPLQPKP